MFLLNVSSQIKIKGLGLSKLNLVLSTIHTFLCSINQRDNQLVQNRSERISPSPLAQHLQAAACQALLDANFRIKHVIFL
jgi:hypothetical protein